LSDRRTGDGGSKLSPQTLIIASLASLTAAIVTSTFWQRGTPITAALTPVIVALASEIYTRPARRITELSSRAAASRSRRFSHELELERERQRVSTGGGPPDRRPEPPDRRPDALRPPDDSELGPMHIYRTEQRSSPIRRVHIRIALLTAAIAFVVAAAVLTLPELVFGGSVASHGKTTFFGGKRHRHATKSTSPEKTKTQTSPTTSTPAPTSTAPSSSTTTPTAPAQTTPSTTTPTQTPAPSSGTPVAPQSQTPTTPAPTP
jgi:hypothetical protein